MPPPNLPDCIFAFVLIAASCTTAPEAGTNTSDSPTAVTQDTSLVYRTLDVDLTDLAAYSEQPLVVNFFARD